MNASDLALELRPALQRVLNSYQSAKRENFTGHPLANTIRNEIPALVIGVLGQDGLGLRIKGSSGQGRWAESPWIAIMDPIAAKGPQWGYYVVYLFAGSLQRLVLSLSQGVSTEVPEMLAPNAALIRSKVPEFRETFSDDPIMLDAKSPNVPAAYYEKGHAFGRTYEATLPPEFELAEDLRKMVRLYRLLAKRKHGL